MIFILVFVFILGSCDDQLLSRDYQGGDWFYLENKGAIMPVWVSGNKSSNVFILYLHGGPGQLAMGERPMSGIPKLEKDYAVVYWDQRGSGISQGNAKPESLTIEQCLEDLWKLVHLIMYPEMGNIDVPILILWGEHDGILPVEMADTAYASFTGTSNKHIYKFGNSAHTPHIEEQDVFVEKVRAFVEDYKSQ
jgi:pimeloyl-ACP methyl ester carboxylesterase